MNKIVIVMVSAILLFIFSIQKLSLIYTPEQGKSHHSYSSCCIKNISDSYCCEKIKESYCKY